MDEAIALVGGKPLDLSFHAGMRMRLLGPHPGAPGLRLRREADSGMARPPGTANQATPQAWQVASQRKCQNARYSSGACSGSIRPSPRMTFLNSGRLTET